MPAPSAAEPARAVFDYALIRVVPRLERGECFNAGVLVYCPARAFLGAKVALDRAKLHALAAGVTIDSEELWRHLCAFVAICDGRPDGGPIARLRPSERFHWLVAPRSTIVQVSPVHAGLCDEPAHALEKLFAKLVGAVDEPAPPA